MWVVEQASCKSYQITCAFSPGCFGVKGRQGVNPETALEPRWRLPGWGKNRRNREKFLQGETTQPDYDHGGNRNWPAFKCVVYKPTLKRAMGYDEPPKLQPRQGRLMLAEPFSVTLLALALNPRSG